MENDAKYSDEVYIKASDFVMNNAPDFTTFNPHLYLINFDFKPYKSTTRQEEMDEFVMNVFHRIVAYMIQKGYIIQHSSQQVFSLTGLSREIKQKGGYYEYWGFINKRDNAIFENVGWNKRAAEAAERSANAAEKTSGFSKTSMILMVVYVLITLALMITGIFTCTYTKRSQTTQTKAINSTTEIKVKRITDTIK